MMTSLSDVWDVWGDEPELPRTNIISAKQSTEDVELKPVQTRLNNDELLKGFQALLLEIHELRREQARRCSVYMIMIGILFGILILYIDRLNHQLSTTKHHHMINRPFA